MPTTVIVDELLCFIASKLDYVSSEELVSLCIKSFSDVIIKESKLSLFSTCNRGPDNPAPVVGVKFRSCRGPNSAENNVKDIIALFNELGDRAPKFAAINLNLIPTVSADKVDVSGLMTTLANLTKEVRCMSQAMLRQEETISNLQRAVVDCSNAKSATYADKTRCASENANANKSPHRRGSSVDPEPRGHIPDDENRRRNDEGEGSRTNDGEWDEPLYVKRKKRRRQFKSGKSVVTNLENQNTGIVGIKRVKRAELFVTRLSPGCTVDDVKSFILRNLDLDANVTKITNTRNASYFSSFHVSCECIDPSVFYNENLWPEHVLYRRWYPPRTARNGVGVLNVDS